MAAAIAGIGELYDEDGKEDPEIGVLKFYLKSWTNPSDSPKFTELKSRDCVEADFEDSEAGRSAMAFMSLSRTLQN